MQSTRTSQPLTRTFLNGHPLNEDNLSVCVVSPSSAQIRTDQELLVALNSVDESTIALIPRSALALNFMEDIQKEAMDGHNASDATAHLQWNETGGVSVTNAVPHMHDTRNVHAAPRPSECPTVFFTRQSILDAVELVSFDRKYRFEVRNQLRKALGETDGTTNDFFYALHALDLSSGTQVELLRCAQDIQKRAEHAGGAYTIDLGEGGYGIVGIPACSVHARYLGEDIARNSSTFWRYFPTRHFSSQ